MPPPGTSEPKSIEEKVRESLELVESGYCSDVEWLMLNRLRDALRQKKQSPRVQSLLNMIQPVLNKYGYHGASATSSHRSTNSHDGSATTNHRSK